MHNHSFDIHLAIEYKNTDVALMIWHFQYWIMKNKALGRNFHEGRYWTYQSIQEVAACFPYWSFPQVKRILSKLVRLNILIKGNFNKSKWDRTVWYAFKDEEKFTISKIRERDFPNMESPREQDIPIMESSDSKCGICTYTNTLTYTEESNQRSPHNITYTSGPSEKSAQKPPETPKLEKAPTATADRLVTLFFKKILENKPDFTKKPTSKWAKVFDELLKIRTEEQLIKVFSWALTHDFWAGNILSPEKFKEKLDTLELQMKSVKTVSFNIEENKLLAKTIEKKFPERVRKCDIYIGYNYIEFKHSERNVVQVKFDDKAFKEQILNNLRKMNLTPGDL